MEQTMKDTDFTYNIVTYGCQMNEKDSSTMAAMLDQIGGRESSRDDAQLLIFNTCCVREHAEDKVFGNVGALKKQLSSESCSFIRQWISKCILLLSCAFQP